ncbi:MAG: dethiobiotin synthase [Arcobacter sp.]|nr:MAG: dethiobiotin synthase [Arcobacter sp.]
MKKKQIYFITATNTDIGKTYASELFLKKFAKKGKKVGYFKPIETGVIDKPLDGTKLLNITKKLNRTFHFTINDIIKYQFQLPASPYVANKKAKINIDILSLISQAKKLLKKCDILIIEGAGGLMVPIKKNYFMIDLIKEFQDNFKMKTILIVPSFLGSINDTLLSQNTLNQYNIKYHWYINLYKNKKEFKKITLPFYQKYFKKIRYLE